jgi:predicted phosphodiesterase
MSIVKITCISDTHTKERQLNLPGGDILIHSGDIMNSGYDPDDITNFLNWFAEQPYPIKIFIAGNHDRYFENFPEKTREITDKYLLLNDILYLQDEEYIYHPNEDNEESGIKIYGSPWQPEFYNWAFNLPRNGEKLEEKWKAIPEDTDILITHGPPQEHLDTSGPPYNEPLLGCELLRHRVDQVKPKIHVFGHIHGGYGYKFHDGTLFINASVLNERYVQTNKPIDVLYNTENKEIEIV